MSHENMADQSAFLQAACTKSKCIELLALAADYREALPQVLELLRQYYAAEKVCFYECGEPDTDGRQEAGSFSVPVIFLSFFSTASHPFIGVINPFTCSIILYFLLNCIICMI